MIPTCKAPEGHEIDFTLNCVYCGWCTLLADEKDEAQIFLLLTKKFIRPRFFRKSWYWCVWDFYNYSAIPEFELHRWACGQFFGLQIMQYFPDLRWECWHLEDFSNSLGIKVQRSPKEKQFGMRVEYGILYERESFFEDFKHHLEKMMFILRKDAYLLWWKKNAKKYSLEEFLGWVYTEWFHTRAGFRVDVHFEDLAPEPDEYIVENIPWEEVDDLPIMVSYTDDGPFAMIGSSPRWKVTLHWAAARDLYFGLEERIRAKEAEGYFPHSISERYVRLHGWPQP